MTEIHLTWAEVLIASQIGCMRNVQSAKLGRGTNNWVEEPWEANIVGAAGEMAVAKHLGMFWSGAIGNIEADDVGPYQVKTNMSRRWDDTIIQKHNTPHKIYIGVLSFLPKFIIMGWINGVDGMIKDYWRDGTPGRTAFFVPRSALHGLETLPRPVD